MSSYTPVGVVVVAVHSGMVWVVVEPEERVTIFGHVLESVLDSFGVVVTFWDGGGDHLVPGAVVERVLVFVDDRRSHLCYLCWYNVPTYNKTFRWCQGPT